MKTAIIIHGMPDKDEYLDIKNPSPTNSHWLPWIQKNLLVNGILAQSPEMPQPYEPNYEKYKAVFEQFTVDEDTLLIGHSCGAGFLVRYLSENPVKVGKVIWVAPWIDPDNEERDRVGDFFDFEINPKLVEQTKGITIMYSTDDDSVILKSVEAIKDAIEGCELEKFEDKGHFVLGDMGTEEFPELLKLCLEN